MKFRLALMALIATAAVAACDRSAEKPSAPPGLTIMANAVPGGVNSQIALWLEQELPGVSREIGAPVTFLPAGFNDTDYKARIALDIKAGRGADVIAIDQFWVPEFAEAGFIMPIDKYLADWPDRAQFYEPIQKMGAFRGHSYLVIWDADVRMIFYNREILAAAGVPLPWEPRSWDDIIAAGRKIKAARPTVTPLQIDAGTSMDEATAMQGFFMVFLGAGGKLYDEEHNCWITDGEPLRRTVDFYDEIYQKDKLADADLQIAAKAREQSFDLMSRGKIAIYVESTWFYSSVLDPGNASWGMQDRDDKIGWARMPGGGRPGDPEFVSISGGNGLIINPHTKDPDRAFKLIAALNRLDRQKRLFLIKPFTPTRRDLAAEPLVQAHEFIARAAAEIMPHTSFRPALPEYPEISFHIQYLTERVATGQLPPDKAIAEFQKAVENVVGGDGVCGR